VTAGSGCASGSALSEPSLADEDRRFREFARSHDRRLRNEIVEAHIGLAVHLASRATGQVGRDEDLQQVALLALVKAVDRFDVDRGVSFATFAGATIEGELKRHFRDATWAMRVPRSVKDLHVTVRRASDDLAQALGRSPTVKELAEHLEVSPDDVVGAIGAGSARRPTSLDAPTPAGDTDPPAAASPLGGAGAVEDRDQVERCLAVLDPREQEIVHLRFYEHLSQDQIAERVGLSQMHVSRLLRRSFEAMRAASRQGDVVNG
jgi:RNA polymerase sigma-B factor